MRLSRPASPPSISREPGAAETFAVFEQREHLSEREAQEVELPFRDPADACLVLVHRQLQLAHDLAQMVQRRFGVAPPTQDHEVVGIDDEASAETSLKAELLPPQP